MKVGAPTGARELAYAEITSDFTQASGTAGTDVTGLSITFTAGFKPIRLEVHAPWVTHSVDQEYVWLAITDGSNNVLSGGQGPWHAPKAGGVGSININKKMTSLTPGTSYTYKVRLLANAGTAKVVAGSGTAHIRAVEVDT